MTLYTPTSNKLYKFFLDTNREDDIPLKWIHQNKPFIMNNYPKAFEKLFPDEDEELESEAADEHNYLNSTIGRGK